MSPGKLERMLKLVINTLGMGIWPRGDFKLVYWPETISVDTLIYTIVPNTEFRASYRVGKSVWECSWPANSQIFNFPF